MADENPDEQILAQKQSIEDHIKQTQALVSSRIPLSSVREEYEAQDGTSGFVSGLNVLSSQYSSINKVRGDGNCFYRAFLYGYLEKYGSDADEMKSFSATIDRSKAALLALGYDEFTVDPFWETFTEYLQSIQDKTKEQLHQDFNQENGECDYLVWYCRLLTSMYLKQNPDRFQPFVDGITPGLSISQFCQQEVEPMGKECEQVQIIALADAVQIGIRIEYLDGHTEPVRSYTCPDNLVPKVTLLYRPGHYDILHPLEN